MPVLNTGLATPARGFTIPYSCRFEDGSSAYLSRTPSSASNQKTWTWSAWIKFGNVGGGGYFISCYQDSNNRSMLNVTGDKLEITNKVGGTKTTSWGVTPLFRDPSAWYHIVWAIDTTDDTEVDRLKLFVNGERVDEHTKTNYPSLNEDFFINSTTIHTLGARSDDSNYIDGYMAEVHFIDGTALTPSSFGETGDYGEWKPKKVEGLTYGTNGFYLDFADAADLGDDESGEGNDWAENNITAADQMLDSPTNNFATLNPLAKYSDITLSEGNLKASGTGTWTGGRATFAIPKTGKWYWEWCVGVTDTQYYHTGIDREGIADPYYQWYKHAATYQNSYDGTFLYGYSSQSGTTTAHSADDIVGWTADDGEIKCYLNNVLKITFSQNLSAIDNDYFPAYSSIYSGDVIANFGQDSSFAGNKTAQGNQDGNGIGDFYYTPPTDFLALCTSNLPAVAVTPSEHFNTVLYSGDDGTQAITGVGFQPDFTWIKCRSHGGSDSFEHILTDAVRGVNKTLSSDKTEAESATNATGYLSVFGTDGFTVTGGDAPNGVGRTYAAWNWKAGNAISGTGDFTQGTIASTCSRNVDAGFSIVSYTGNGSNGATWGHGLSKAPEIVFIKNRDSAQSWPVWGAHFDRMILDGTVGNLASYIGTFSSTLVTMPDHDDSWNGNTHNLIAYCFHSVDGYSKVGSYTGNNNADGTFIYTGFRPAFVIIKRTGSAEHWTTYDNKRDTYNVAEHYLLPSATNAENTYSTSVLDFVSNGIKIRGTDDTLNNADSDPYIYIAFAETPFKYSNAR